MKIFPTLGTFSHHLKLVLPSKYMSSKLKPNIQEIRNIDYEEQRKQAIAKYNQSLKYEKKIYQQGNKYQLKRKVLRKQKDYDKQSESTDQEKQRRNQYFSKLRNHELDLQRNLLKINEDEKTNVVKLYLHDNIREDNDKIRVSTIDRQRLFIPQGLILKKVYHSEKKNSNEIPTQRQILLAGIQKEEQHCIFLKKMIESLKITNVITMMAPDLPFFIKTQYSYNHTWQRFLDEPQYAKKAKFYLNPLPKCLKDIRLDQNHINLVKNSLAKSKNFLNTYYYMMQENDLSQRFQPNPFFEGLYANGVKNIYFADFPAFQERQMMANNISLGRLRELFGEHLRNFRKGQFNFSAQWLFPKVILTNKLNHIIGICRSVSEISQQRSILICPSQMAELISIQWQLNNKEASLNYNIHDGNYYFNQSSLLSQAPEQSFLEFIEKLVILDMIMEPIISNYFVKYRSFPFSCENTIGGKENIGKIFMVWMHYYKTYFEVLSQKRLSIDGSQERKQKIMEKFQHPTDFT